MFHGSKLKFSHNKRGFKRKAFGKDNFRTKVSKPTSDTVTLSFTNLPAHATDESLHNFIRNSGLNVKAKSCRANYRRRKAFVDFNSWDVKRALELNEMEWNGQHISVVVDGEEVPDELITHEKPTQLKEQQAKKVSSTYTMFCKNLPHDTNENEIAELFRDVLDVRVVRYPHTKKLKGYCYIDFKSKRGLDAAYAKKGDVKLHGNQLHLDLCGVVSDNEKAGNLLYVRGITNNVDEKVLLQNLEGAVDARIMREGAKDFVGYVHFDSEESAKKVYESSDGVFDVATQLTLEYLEDGDSENQNEIEKFTLHCKNLPFNTNEKQLRALFDHAIDVRITKNKLNNKFNGSAYVDFPSQEALDFVIEQKDLLELRGRKISVVACTASDNAKELEKTLLVRGLPANLDKTTLMNNFLGAVNAKVFHELGTDELVGHVYFDSEDEARLIYDKSKGEVEITTRLYVQFAKERDSGRTILCLRNLTEQIDKPTLLKFFDRAVDVLIVEDASIKNKVIHRRFAYVKFKSEAEATKIFESSKNGLLINGVNVKVDFAKRKAQSKCLCVRGVFPCVGKDALLEKFQLATEARILPDKRIAFLDFSSELDAAKTYHENLNGVIVNGCSLTLIPTKDKISNSRRGRR